MDDVIVDVNGNALRPNRRWNSGPIASGTTRTIRAVVTDGTIVGEVGARTTHGIVSTPKADDHRDVFPAVRSAASHPPPRK